jgi:hypothetical protein
MRPVLTALTPLALRALPLRALSLLALPLLPAALPAQHTHGVAELEIAVEGRTAELRFTASAEDVYGFERQPRTDAERAKKTAAFTALRSKGATLLKFDPALGCTITAGTVEDLSDPKQTSHLEVLATYNVRCAKDLAKSRLRVGAAELFPGVTKVKATRVSEDGATTKTLGRADFIEL